MNKTPLKVNIIPLQLEHFPPPQPGKKNQLHHIGRCGAAGGFEILFSSTIPSNSADNILLILTNHIYLSFHFILLQLSYILYTVSI